MRKQMGSHMGIKRIAVATLAMVLSVVAMFVASSSSAQASTPSYLFTVQAVSGATGSPSSPPGEDERFSLSLRGVDPITKFSDRPFRSASVMSPKALVSNWNSWFADSAPNAVLTYSAGAGKAPQSIVVTLARPRIDSTGRVLTFTATRTYRTLDPSQKGKNWIRPLTPRTFSSASVFIDNAGQSAPAGLIAALQQAMQPYVFSPNNANTWAAVASAMSTVLTTAWQHGSLMGSTASSAYTVNCQMFSAQQILNGYLACAVTMQLPGGTLYNTTLTQQMATSG
jgi:hypothetical protein